MEHGRLRHGAQYLVGRLYRNVRALLHRPHWQARMQREVCPMSLVHKQRDAAPVAHARQSLHVGAHPVVGRRHHQDGPHTLSQRSRPLQSRGQGSWRHSGGDAAGGTHGRGGIDGGGATEHQRCVSGLMAVPRQNQVASWPACGHDSCLYADCGAVHQEPRRLCAKRLRRQLLRLHSMIGPFGYARKSSPSSSVRSWRSTSAPSSCTSAGCAPSPLL
mmetsp:Transcript_44538/g.112676  ORF Transcript_44538/g.112676 Transcript_44538/m.112676 type:complete len:217 (+) Transcript_44538:828-1478(+)